ncbi:MAG: hypothetical protein ACFFG0_04865 [Candidatus Thorarchaeota archaeon]
MKIFEENGKIRLQLMELTPVPRMLFDFTIDKETFEPMKAHIIEHLNRFTLKGGAD